MMPFVSLRMMHSAATVSQITMAIDVNSVMMNVVFHQDPSVSTVESAWMRLMVFNVNARMDTVETSVNAQGLKRT